MRKHKLDGWILSIVVGFLLFGLLVIYTTSPMWSNFMGTVYGNDKFYPDFFFHRQLIYVFLSLVAIFLGYKISFEKVMSRFGKWIFVIAVVLCLLLFGLALAGSGLANCQLGACRGFNFSFFGFQPAELLKIGTVFYLANLLARKKKEGVLDKKVDFFLPVGSVLGLVMFLVAVLQKDLGSAVVIAGIIFSMMMVSGVGLKKILVFVGVMLVAGVMLIELFPHRKERIAMNSNAGKMSYHTENALIAIGSGGLFGVGLGNNVQATGYLPESLNDSVFAVMGELVGFVGLSLIVVLFGVLLFRLIKIIETGGSDEHKMIAGGMLAWMGAQMLFNVGGMMNMIYMTGITLPLFSYGGTSLIFVSFMLGVCLQLSCYTNKYEDIDSRRGVGRAYNSSRSGASRGFRD